MANWIADRRLYLTEDGKATDKPEEGRWLLIPLGGELTDGECRQYGLGPYATKPSASSQQLSAENEGSEMRGVGLRTPRNPRSRSR